MAKYPIHADDPDIDKAIGVFCNRLGIVAEVELLSVDVALPLVCSLELV